MIRRPPSSTLFPYTPFSRSLLSLLFLRRLSPQRGGRSLARPPLSLAERLQLLSCDLERARPARTAGAERGGSMFEATQEAKASGASKGLWIVFAVVVVAIAAAGFSFFSKEKKKKPFPFWGGAAPPPGPPHPVRALKGHAPPSAKNPPGKTAVGA